MLFAGKTLAQFLLSEQPVAGSLKEPLAPALLNSKTTR